MSVRVKPGDLVLSICATVGRPMLIDMPACIHDGFVLLDDLKDTDPEFLYYQFQANESVLRGSGQSGTQTNINTKIVESFHVHWTSKPEQTAISRVLAAVDRAMEQTEALLAKHERIKAGLMHDLLTRGLDAHGRLRDPATHKFKPSSLGPIPDEWNDASLDSVAHRGSGHTPSKSHPEYWNGGIKWVSLADTDRLDRVFLSDTVHEISALGIRNSSAVEHPPGVVILSRDAGIGKSAITTTMMAVSQHFMAWRCGLRLNNFFLYYSLQVRKPEFEAVAIGSTIKTIGLRFFREMHIALPPIEEQVQIGKALFAADQEKFSAETHLAKLRRLKAGLMQDLLTGRVSVAPLLGAREVPG